MIVTLISQQHIRSMTLPERISGRYWLADEEENGHLCRMLNAEGQQDGWVLHAGEPLALLGADDRETPSLRLVPGRTQVLQAQYRASGEKVRIFAEPVRAGSQQYRKYCLHGNCELSIGRGEDNQIVFSGNPYVSGHHAKLIFQDNAFSIVDTQSSNGTFVNGARAALTPLAPGDSVYIMGLRILIGGGFFAVNDPDGTVKMHTDAVYPFVPQPEAPDAPMPECPPEEPFFRSPRFCRSVEKAVWTVDGPPNPDRIEDTPAALVIGPALTMGLTSVMMAAVAFINYENGEATLLNTAPAIVMALAMLCGTLLWPSLTRRSEKKRRQGRDRQRQEKYREYLAGVEDRLDRLGRQQREILLQNSPSPAECAARILERQRSLWERTPAHADFLELRLGLGELPLAADIRWPDSRFTLEDDNLQHDVARLRDKPKLLQDVPVCCSLQSDPAMGVLGTPAAVRAYVCGLILELAALHSCEEVKFVFLLDEESLPQWDFVRWLPHVWDDGRTMRCLAADEAEARALSVPLEHILAERTGAQTPKSALPLPRYVVFAVSREVAEKAPFYAQALAAPESAGFACVCLAQELSQLPKECAKVVELGAGGAVLYDKQELSGSRMTLKTDSMAGIDMDAAARALAGIRPDSQRGSYQLPTMISFLEMYGVGKVEHLNALTRWKENNPVNSLAVPVGRGEDGELFELDLHEKFHGPHGLVAGMTGSGKSEFIITYILSLALNYSPEEVAFILIDYKGGGLAGAFENPEKGVRLPHLAGTITNLDGAAVKRSLISIQSELRRRQAIFNEARRVSGEGTIDIYKYQKMYRSHQVGEAVPHLFIISDEFAELKAQQPEFMAQLISAARIGRSLGVHLILATQKPSGVVDDQIWSNSRFHVCLKVQDRSDSMDMLKRPDAAELAETGRFYLQVGFNEFFAKGQSAWCGAPYHPADRPPENRDDRVAVLDHLGRVLSEAKPRPARKTADAEVSQVVAIVDYLSGLAAAEGVAARRLWLDAVPAHVEVDDIRSRYALGAEKDVLAPVVGEYDDPFNQKQGPLTLPLSEEGSVLIYGATGSGKIQLLNAMLYDLLGHYDSTALNAYLLDLGEESLQNFAAAPQVGGVLLSGDTERITNLLRMLREELADRKKKFAAYGGDYRAWCRAGNEALPQIVFVLHNYSAFTEQYESLEDSLIQLLREGPKYGFSFVFTASGASSVRYRVMQNFRRMIVLQLNDRTDYTTLLGNTDGVYPSAVPGRGIFKTDRTYEFQTASIGAGSDAGTIRAFAAHLTGRRARPVPQMPGRVDSALFAGSASFSAFPLGIEKISLQPALWDWSRQLMLPLAAQDAFALESPVLGVAQLLGQLEGASLTVLDGSGLLPKDPAIRGSCTANDFEPAVSALFAEMVRRNNTYKNALKAGETPPAYAPQFYVFTGLGEILSQLSAKAQDELRTLLEKAELPYQIRFVLCDTAKGMAQVTGDAWYRRQIGGADGAWAGDGVCEQHVLNLAKISNDMYAELPQGFGYVLSHGRPVLTRLLGAQEQEETE